MSKAASSNSAVNRMCKAVHPFLSQHLVRVLTEDAVEALADHDKTLLVQHLCPHNQPTTFAWQRIRHGGKGMDKNVHQECVQEFARRKDFASTCHFCESQKDPMSEQTKQVMRFGTDELKAS